MAAWADAAMVGGTDSDCSLPGGLCTAGVVRQSASRVPCNLWQPSASRRACRAGRAPVRAVPRSRSDPAAKCRVMLIATEAERVARAAHTTNPHQLN
ncbi:hypothetical protein PGTUg99_029678 [Puccinia graminis f. sp. tritici]|uniref:Uncharacterized protein n=1 Tax=Puccinia graminis f. sp. tritici TaxID=56615 RepID=A0A5B0RG46_PUCGR|nr:hypothetical protein PGTUg99_029678 [Puccinia graminis f. sp. tritici]